MYKVSIKNLDNFVNWSTKFEKYEDAVNWTVEQLKKPGRMQQPLEELIVDVSAQIALEKAKSDAKAHLLNTDWYVIRFMDSGIEIPAEIKSSRQAARELL